jgi:hypothetical protein
MNKFIKANKNMILVWLIVEKRGGFTMIRKFEGFTANDLIEILSNYPKNTKVCNQILGENFPFKVVEECIYYDWKDGKKINEHKGILIK